MTIPELPRLDLAVGEQVTFVPIRRLVRPDATEWTVLLLWDDQVEPTILSLTGHAAVRLTSLHVQPVNGRALDIYAKVFALRRQRRGYVVDFVGFPPQPIFEKAQTLATRHLKGNSA